MARPPSPLSDAERFWAKVDKSGPCWLWMGARQKQGYGNFKRRGVAPTGAHRLAYEWTIGPIPAGLTIDHLCNNPPCVNPSHLRVATQRENTLRGGSPHALNARKTHCPRGHEYAGSNVKITTDGGRVCLPCRRARDEQERRAAGIRPLGQATHCRRGHEFTAENTYVRPSGGRACRECVRDRERSRSGSA